MARDAMAASVVTLRTDGNRIVGIVAQADLALDTSDELTGDVVEDVYEPKR